MGYDMGRHGIFNPRAPTPAVPLGNDPGPTHPNATNPYEALLAQRIANRRLSQPLGIQHRMARRPMLGMTMQGVLGGEGGFGVPPDILEVIRSLLGGYL